MADQSEKSKTKEVSSESRVEQSASRAGSEQAQADMPEHLQQSQKEKSAFDRAGLVPTARSHVSETFGRPEISEESDGEKILHVAEVSDKKAAKTNDPHPSYTIGLEAARKTAATPEEAAQMEVQFTEQYIEKKLQEAATTSGKDPAELLNQHEYDPEDPNHGGTFEIPQNADEVLAAARNLEDPQEGTIRIGNQQYSTEVLLASKDGQQRPSRLTKLRAEIDQNIKAIRESNAPPGNKLVGIAQELGRDPVRWQSKTTGKCNQLVGEAIKQCFGKTPWEGPTPTCHGLNRILGNSSEWEKVWVSGGRDFKTALTDFQEFQPKQGDIVIWDNERTHSGILDEDKFLHYAGSRENDTGYAKSHIRYYTGTPKRPMDFGAPTVIYRHKTADQWTK